MWARVLLLIAAAGGCVFLPRTEDASTFVTSEVERVVPPPAAGMGIEVTSLGSTITLRASEPRVCQRETWEVTDVQHNTRVGFDILTGDDDVGLLLAVFTAPVTMPVSALITLLVVVSDKGSATRERHRVGSTPYECPVLRGNVPIKLTLPSGTLIELTTDREGIASFTVPPEEPDAGVIEVNVELLGARRVRYDRASTRAIVDKPPPPASESRAACIERRRELMLSAQQISNAKERGQLLQHLPTCAPK